MANVPRDIYAGEIDFTTLALQYSAFAKKLKPNRQLDFSDPEAVRRLTKSLLHRDFSLEIDLPEDRLCPPVPNRLNYIFWLQDLLDTTSDDYRDRFDPKREVLGLDIGTGASAIYPLLGCRQRDKWKFVATDIDEKSLQYAGTNIAQNDLSNRVKLLATTPHDRLIPPSLFTNLPTPLDFTVCNPPFYSSPEDLLHSAALKSRPPHSSCTGAQVEMVTPGGELAFISRLIDESQTHKTHVKWYTTMLGKLSSVQTIVEKLIEVGCGNYAVTEFVQGGKTRRWGVGWSWGDLRPTVAVARGIPGFPKHLLPFPSEAQFTIRGRANNWIGHEINDEFSSMDILWQWRHEILTGVGFALGNVWSRQARRKKAHHGDEMTFDDFRNRDDEDVEENAALGFKISITRLEDRCILFLRWLKGTDAKLFESFTGMLRRRLKGV